MFQIIYLIIKVACHTELTSFVETQLSCLVVCVCVCAPQIEVKKS